MKEHIHLNSVSELHDFFDLPRPRHPLISLYPHGAVEEKVKAGMEFRTELYQISLKDGISCEMGYGRNSYDFDDGAMVFLAPGQTFFASNVKTSSPSLGWNLVFHPDFIKKSDLGKKIDDYTFFNYEVHEALHLSEKEIATVTDLGNKIREEYDQNMDRHSQKLIRSNLEMLLDYCVRYYDRQFYTRSDLNADYLSRFMGLLDDYYKSDMPLDQGIPSVQYCGRELGLSPYYLSDLLKRETGKNALEHIHLFLIGRAKALILNRDDSITKIAYDLGFEYPQHFSKLFKSKTGMSPREFRAS